MTGNSEAMGPGRRPAGPEVGFEEITAGSGGSPRSSFLANFRVGNYPRTGLVNDNPPPVAESPPHCRRPAGKPNSFTVLIQHARVNGGTARRRATRHRWDLPSTM